MWWLSNGTHKYGMCETCRHLGCETKKKRYKSACGIDQMEDNIEDLTDYFGYWIWLGVSSVQAWSMGRCRVYRGSLFLTNSRDRYPAFGNKTCVCHVPHTCLRAKYTHFIATSRAWSSSCTTRWGAVQAWPQAWKHHHLVVQFFDCEKRITVPFNLLSTWKPGFFLRDLLPACTAQVPLTAEIYVHRSGRTGRANQVKGGANNDPGLWKHPDFQKFTNLKKR